ncbi:MAG: hypothetical protein FWF53_11480 [Candidatus Azobacteroides sp.]|nr:hypothetical protein [Candidatus Azobacteroides sp.]
MKNLDLNAYGVKEMENAELGNVNGGVWGPIGAVLLAIAIDICLNPSSSGAAFAAGYNASFN